MYSILAVILAVLTVSRWVKQMTRVPPTRGRGPGERDIDWRARSSWPATSCSPIIFVVRLANPNSPATRKSLNIKNREKLQAVYILAACRQCIVKKGALSELEKLDIHLYSKLGPLDIVNIAAVETLVGRVPDTEEKWAIIDWSGSLARAIAEEAEDEQIDIDT